LVKENKLMGYRLPKPVKKRNVALTQEELEVLLNLQLPKEYSHMTLSLDMFIFRYRCAGMRIRDQLYLKHKNVRDGILDYQMGKTKRHIRFELHPDCLRIIDKYRGRGGVYIFPVLKGDETVKQIKDRVSSLNAALRKVAKFAGIEKDLSTHVARHSFAAHNRKLNPYDLRDLLGHGSITTTQDYVDSLDQPLEEIMKRVRKKDQR
jgi:integrase